MLNQCNKKSQQVLHSQSVVDCHWFQGVRAGRGMKGEKGIVGFPGNRVSWSLAPQSSLASPKHVDT